MVISGALTRRALIRAFIVAHSNKSSSITPATTPISMPSLLSSSMVMPSLDDHALFGSNNNTGDLHEKSSNGSMNMTRVGNAVNGNDMADKSLIDTLIFELHDDNSTFHQSGQYRQRQQHHQRANINGHGDDDGGGDDDAAHDSDHDDTDINNRKIEHDPQHEDHDAIDHDDGHITHTAHSHAHANGNGNGNGHVNGNDMAHDVDESKDSLLAMSSRQWLSPKEDDFTESVIESLASVTIISPPTPTHSLSTSTPYIETSNTNNSQRSSSTSTFASTSITTTTAASSVAVGGRRQRLSKRYTDRLLLYVFQLLNLSSCACCLDLCRCMYVCMYIHIE
jgi:hypothetical protein